MTLIEVVVAAALMMVMALGILSTFSAADHLTSEEQHRSEATQLAQQDEERVKGLQVSTLQALNQTRTVQLSGTTFTLTSTGQFYSSTSTNASCSSNGSADYIKTTSTVTWPTIGSRPPVAAESLLTPPTSGALVVQVMDAGGNGVPNVTVNGTGPQALSGTTGSDGCAIFANITAGRYSIAVSKTGYVDRDGNSSPPSSQQTVTVVAGASATKTFQFDRAGTLAVTFATKPYGAGSFSADQNDTLVLFHNGMTLPSVRNVGTSGSEVSQLNVSNLFPFTSAYTLYAGTCSADAPSQFGGTDPAVTIPSGGAGSFNVGQGANVIPLPALNVTVYKGWPSGGPPGTVANPRVVVTDQGCGGSPPSAGGTPLVKLTPATTSGGRLVDPGLPYGTYSVCADDSPTNSKPSYNSATVTNSNLAGTTVDIYLGKNAPGVASGSCP